MNQLASAPFEMSINSQSARHDPVYFVLHIPKTAGQTVQVHLAEHCAPGVFWQSHRRVRHGSRRSPDLPDFGRVRVLSGHHIGKSLERFFPGREIRRVLLMRDPLQLQISWYNWQMMDNLAKDLGTYSFDLHLRAVPHNFIAHFLLSRWLEIPWPMLMAMGEEQKYQMLNRALADFWFVGAHTDCDRVIEAVGSDLGVPPAPVRRNTSVALQAQTGWRLVTEDTLSQPLCASIRSRHSLDQALWQSWRSAGFDAAKVRPHPLGSPRKSGFLGHEIVRPWFVCGRYVRRQLLSRLHRGGGAAVSRGNRARDLAQWELAVRHYREALRAAPNASAIWVQYGHALKETGKLAEAEEAYRRSIALSPETADTHLQLGHALKLQGRIDEAAEAYLHAAMLDPERRDPRNELISLGWAAAWVEQLAQPAPGRGGAAAELVRGP